MEFNLSVAIAVRIMQKLRQLFQIQVFHIDQRNKAVRFHARCNQRI